MAKSRAQMIEEWLDREAIRQLPLRYGKGSFVNSGEMQGGVFAREGSFGIPGRPGYMQGRANLQRGYAYHLADVTPRPLFHNHAIELLGNGRARGRVINEVRTMRYGMLLMGVGFYDEEYIKEDGEWKILSRKATWYYRNEHPLEPH